MTCAGFILVIIYSSLEGNLSSSYLFKAKIMWNKIKIILNHYIIILTDSGGSIGCQNGETHDPSVGSSSPVLTTSWICFLVIQVQIVFHTYAS